jgi:hypothetical protein
MAVTEQEAVNVLPPPGFVRYYVQYGFQQTAAPLIYHYGVALAILSVTCPATFGMHYAGPLHPNSYVLLVGRSGEDNKSTALNLGRRLLDKALPGFTGSEPGSPEGMLESLQQKPTQVLALSEFGKFLASAQRGYFEPIKAMLADAWDAHTMERRKAKQVTVRVEDPRLSIMAACSVPYLEKHTLAEDWTGGFMGRWIVFYGRRERSHAVPRQNLQLVPTLVQYLQTCAGTPTIGPCQGFDPGAQAHWTQWYNQLMQRPLPSNVIGIRARAPTMALKIAMLYAWDFGTARSGQPWQIDTNVLAPAIALTELHIKSLVSLSRVIAEHPDARLRRSVLHCLEERQGSATLGAILDDLKMRKRPVVEILDALLESGRVRKIKTIDGHEYEIV